MKKYSHDIEKLYNRAVAISNQINEKIPEKDELHKIDKKILEFLSIFAKTTRYYNLNALSSMPKEECPLTHWNFIIMMIVENDLTKKQRERILTTAEMICDKIDDITATTMQGLDKKPLSTHAMVALPELHRLSAKFAMLRIFNILYPLKKLIRSLSYNAYNYQDITHFPQMHEFIEWIPPTDREWRSYVLRKRKWP